LAFLLQPCLELLGNLAQVRQAKLVKLVWAKDSGM
jgi:hypothetical protein